MVSYHSEANPGTAISESLVNAALTYPPTRHVLDKKALWDYPHSYPLLQAKLEEASMISTRK